MTLKVAIVGMGGIGNRHASIYHGHDACEVVAVCDIDKERSDKAAEKYGCPGFYSIQDMVRSGIQIDATSMCTAGTENGGDHHQATIDLLNAGLPVLGEKPISNEIEKAKEMVALAKEKNLRYGVNLNHRFTPAARRAKEWIEAGRCGELNIINMHMWINNPNETSPHFHMRALHPHSIDVMRFFAGDVKKVQAFYKKGKGRKIWSNVQVNMQFENGMIGHLTGSYDAGGTYGLEELDMIGSEGRIILREACQSLEYYPRFSQEMEVFKNLGGMQSWTETFDDRIGRWIQQNVDQVAPSEIEAPGEDALKAQLVIEAAIESWENDSVVTL
ncbi:MAG: Gfo/Idh/MocA family oxidoreductase [Chloroflexota bacterium]